MKYNTWIITLIDPTHKTYEYKMEAENREDAVKQAMNRAFVEMPTNRFGLVEIQERITDSDDKDGSGIIHFSH